MTSTTVYFAPAQLLPKAKTDMLRKFLAKLAAARTADANRTVARYLAETRVSARRPA